MADDTQSTPDLSGIWLLLNAGLGGVDPNSSESQSTLQAVRHYDPNAHFAPYISGGSVHGYNLVADLSKLPKINDQSLGGAVGEGGAGYGGRWRPATGNWAADVIDPSKVVSDPNYGRITDYSNINYNDPGDMMFRMLGLGGVGLFGFGAPYLASAMSEGAIGGSTPGMYAIGGSGAGGGGGLSGELLPMMPNPNPYTPMLPFNPGDPSYGLFASPAAAAGGGGLSGELLPLIPNENPYNPMLPFNPADPSYSGLPHGLWDRIVSAAGKVPPGALSGLLGGPPTGLGGAGGGGRGGGGGSIASEDALAILARYWGVPQETAKRIAQQAAQQQGA